MKRALTTLLADMIEFPFAPLDPRPIRSERVRHWALRLRAWGRGQRVVWVVDYVNERVMFHRRPNNPAARLTTLDRL